MTSAGAASALPAHFVWGVATAAYQVEGAAGEDGRGPSTWDAFCAQPGRVVDGSSGAVACDHYHRYAADVALLRDLGVGAYRFSFAWPRIQPTGRGPANAKGLDFYDRLIDELLGAGIAPAATIYHWDTPLALEEAGGWLDRDITGRFADYAAILAERFADRVAWWMPVNEPNIVTMLGHALGVHAPGRRLGLAALPVAHHLLLAHGRAVQALRAAGAKNVGTAQNHAPVWPASDHEDDRAAATLFDTVFNRVFADPVLLGRYPEGFDRLMPGPVDEDLRVISAPLDFYGFNYYSPSLVGAPARHPEASGLLALGDGDGAEPLDLPFATLEVEGYPRTDFGWPVVPDGLTELLVTLKERYGYALSAVFTTENGCSYLTGPDADGRVADGARIDYLRSHLHALEAARAQGVDVRGYFHWSFMDNFEWAEGYTQRFGLVYVEYETQQRFPKDSFHWYRDHIARSRLTDVVSRPG